MTAREGTSTNCGKGATNAESGDSGCEEKFTRANPKSIVSRREVGELAAPAADEC